MKLSLCTIVRDDELLISKMLESVVGVVDEVVLCDTGSTDNTVAVAEAFAYQHEGLVKIVHFEWCDDFSAARNYSMKHATGDWILILDADEFLDSEGKQGLRAHLEKTTVDGVFVKSRSYGGSMKNLQNVWEADVCRIFRRGYEYVGALHEQIVGTIQARGGTVGSFPLRLHHVGYTAEYISLKHKQQRNLEILEEELRVVATTDRGQRWFSQTNLLAEYGMYGDWESLSKLAKVLIGEMTHVSPKKRPVYLPRVYKFYLYALEHMERYEDALSMAKEALRLYPEFTDLHIIKAEIHMCRHEYNEAISVLKMCRKLGDVKFNFVEYTEGNGTYLAARLLGHCWLRLGDDLTAREWFVKAYSENTEYPSIIPWVTLLTPEPSVLHTMEKGIQTPQRYDEFVQYYSYLGFDDALKFIDKAENTWGSTQATRRSRFAFEVRHGLIPTLPDAATNEDKVRMGLWYYEQGDKSAANILWAEAGVIGQYYEQIQKTNMDVKWVIANVLDDIWSSKAIHFLRDYGPFISDFENAFRTLSRSDLLEAFSDEAYLQDPSRCIEEAEWKAQLCLARGDNKGAQMWLDQAYLPNGERTVRGAMIAGDTYKADQKDIVRTARQVYPESKLLSYYWLNYFVPSSVPQGVVM